MGVALVHEGDHVVVGVDVKPDAAVAEPVGQAHARARRCRSPLLGGQVAGQEVDVAELAGPKAGQHAWSSGRCRDARRHPRETASARSGYPRHRRARCASGSRSKPTPQAVRCAAGVVERDAAAKLEAGVLVAGLARHQLQRVRLVSRSARSARSARALGQGEPELERPAGGRLIHIGDAQAHVVDAAEIAITIPTAALGFVLRHRERDVQRAGPRPRADRRAGQVDCPLLDGVIREPAEPRSTSTSTTSPGSIGRELAGVPVRITSPGSSVIRRHRSASWYATAEDQVGGRTPPARPRR